MWMANKADRTWLFVLVCVPAGLSSSRCPVTAGQEKKASELLLKAARTLVCGSFIRVEVNPQLLAHSHYDICLLPAAR